MIIKPILSLLIAIPLLFGCRGEKVNSNFNVKFEPPDGKILVFIGQDNESVGGNDRFKNGYVDNIETPAGITHYIGIDTTDKNGLVRGLNIESTWGAGPMCLKYYLDSPTLINSVIHLSIAMTNNLKGVAEGTYDNQIDELAKTLKNYDQFPFIIRIGYEFDGEWNDYDSTNFKKAFRRIVDHLRTEQVENFATCMAASSFLVPISSWRAYYPGDNYVDWLGYSYWGGNPNSDTLDSFIFAKEKNKPLFIAEIAPRGHYIKSLKNGKVLWDTWYKDFFNHVSSNLDYVKAISYINCDWDVQEMWDGWGDSRIQANNYIKSKWVDMINNKLFINADDNPYKQINFK